MAVKTYTTCANGKCNYIDMHKNRSFTVKYVSWMCDMYCSDRAEQQCQAGRLVETYVSGESQFF